MAGFNRQRLIFGAYLLVLITIAEVVAGAFHLPAWPAFMAMIFFFVEHMDPKKVSQILVGAVVGVACILLAGPIVRALAPLMGLEAARLVFILGIVFAIVAFGEMLPLVARTQPLEPRHRPRPGCGHSRLTSSRVPHAGRRLRPAPFRAVRP